MSFNLIELLNARSKETTINDIEQPGAGQPFEIKLISVHKLIPSKENFYSVEDIADIKDSIEMFGIQQNLVVSPINGSDTYKVIAGHRRRLGSLALVAEGKGQFEFVPCKEETDPDEIKAEILLIHINSTIRDFTTWEKATQLARLKELFREYKKHHDIPGRIRDLLAETLKISPSQVSRMESINENLVMEFKEELKQDNIGFSTAAELSRLPAADQRAVYEQHKETGQTNLKTVQTIREKKVETTQPTPTPATPPAQPEQESQTITIIDEMQELLNSLVKIRGQYKHLINIPAGEKALKALEALNALIYDDIEAIKAGVLGEPLFNGEGGGASE